MTDRSFEFLSVLAYIYLQHGQPAKALPLLKSLAAIRPTSVDVARSLAYAHLEAGDYEHCLQHVQKSFREFPDLQQSVSLRLIRCRALWKLGRTEQARALAQEWSREQPTR